MSTTTTPPRRPARANTAWWWALLIWTVSIGFTVGAMQLLGHWNQAWNSNGMMTAFAALTPAGRLLLHAGLLAIWIVGTVRIARATRRSLLAPILAVVAVVVSLIAGALVGGHVYARWQEHHRTEAPDGHEYVALSRMDIIDHVQALGRVREPGILSETIEVLDEGELYAGYVGYVLVPIAFDAPAGLFVAALPHGGVALLEREAGTDAEAVCLVVAPDGSEPRLGPFALFDANDEGDPRELDRWRKWIEDSDWRLSGLDIREVAADIGHPNAWVRAAAASLVEAASRRRVEGRAGQGR